MQNIIFDLLSKASGLFIPALKPLVFLILTQPAIADNVNSYSAPEGLGPEDFDYSVIETFANSNEQGILTAVLGDPDLNSSELQVAYHASSESAIKFRLLVGNYLNAESAFNILCILNYKQHQFSLDDHQSNVHRISLNAGERRIYNVKLEPLSKGAYDIVFLIKKDVSDPSDDGLKLITHRANIYVESDEYHRRKTSEVKELQPTFPMPDVSLVVTPDIDVESDLFANHTISNADRNFFALVNNSYETKMSYALLLFVNEVQISAVGRDPARFFKLSENTYTKLNFHLPQDIQQADSLWAVLIENPYARLEQTRGTLAQIPAQIYLSNMLTSASKYAK